MDRLKYLSSIRTKKDISLQMLKDEEPKRYTDIYSQIIEYFETQQPYLNPDFKITSMASELNTNTTYLTRAIRENANVNFNGLTNHYRIKTVKKLMKTNPSHFTLEYIYLSAGFKSQASFNRAFKKEENMTPSDYYSTIQEKIKKDIID